MTLIDCTNQRFGSLLVLSRVKNKTTANRGDGNAWLCLCVCGKQIQASGTQLRRGRSSCGCKHKENLKKWASQLTKTHGMSHNSTYRIWGGMRKRCLDKKSTSYPRYGGRGIKVCKRWNEFENFLHDMGHRPDGKSIDRINSDGNYEPSNCRWATPKEQAKNRKKPKARLIEDLLSALKSARLTMNTAGMSVAYLDRVISKAEGMEPSEPMQDAQTQE